MCRFKTGDRIRIPPNGKMALEDMVCKPKIRRIEN